MKGLGSTFWLRSGGTPLLVLLLIVAAGCSSTPGIVAPFGEDDPIPAGEGEQAGLDLSELESISRHLTELGDHEVHSILVVRGGRLVFERYYNGYGPNNPHDIRSATKSITSLLTGVAIERGAIAGVDTPLMHLLGTPYHGVRDNDDILLRHLLTMSSGLDATTAIAARADRKIGCTDHATGSSTS